MAADRHDDAGLRGEGSRSGFFRHVPICDLVCEARCEGDAVDSFGKAPVLTNTKVGDYAHAPDGLRIGHMHLRVGDLAQASGFYRAAIGFNPTRERQGAAFLSSGRYHHHLGLNVWRSAGAGRRDDKATGLAWFSLEIERPDLFDAQEERLRKAGSDIVTVTDGVEAGDPWGTRVRLIRL